MTIFILANDPKRRAEYLDDESLDKMIKDISQVLCNVHHDLLDEKENLINKRTDLEIIPSNFHWECMHKEIPLDSIFVSKNGLLEWSRWARECLANYNYLVGLGLLCLFEYRYVRHGGIKQHKFHHVINFARDNVPDLPVGVCTIENGNLKKTPDTVGEYEAIFGLGIITPLPLVMPKKYIKADLSNQLNNTIPGEVFNGTILAYRNYYQGKLKQKQCMKHDACIYAQQKCCLRTKPYWTSREKPEWLKQGNDFMLSIKKQMTSLDFSKFHKNRYYKLDENKNAIPCSFEEFSEQYKDMMEHSNLHVEDENINGYWVSTVWLGVNHNHLSDENPLIFETMIFKTGYNEIYCERYSTWAQAEEGHKKAVEWVKNGCKEEDL